MSQVPKQHPDGLGRALIIQPLEAEAEGQWVPGQHRLHNKKLFVPSRNRMGLINASPRSGSTYPSQGHHDIKVLPDSCGSLAGFMRQMLRRRQRKGLKGQLRISDELTNSTYISDYKYWPTLYLANKLGFFFELAFFLNKVSTQHYEIGKCPISISNPCLSWKREGGTWPCITTSATTGQAEWRSFYELRCGAWALPQSPPLHVASILPKLIIIAKPHHTCTDVSAIVHGKENKPCLCERDEGYTIREHI